MKCLLLWRPYWTYITRVIFCSSGIFSLAGHLPGSIKYSGIKYKTNINQLFNLLVLEVKQLFRLTCVIIQRMISCPKELVHLSGRRDIIYSFHNDIKT